MTTSSTNGVGLTTSPCVQVKAICNQQRETLLRYEDYKEVSSLDEEAREAYYALPKAVDVLHELLKPSHPEIAISFERDVEKKKWRIFMFCSSTLESESEIIKQSLVPILNEFKRVGFILAPRFYVDSSPEPTLN